MDRKKNKSFGDFIRSFREKANLPLRTVADDLNIDHSLLGKIERNERQPTKEFIRQVATYYKANEKDLIKEYLSDQIAYRILDEDENIAILKVAEKKIKYMIKHKK